MRPPQGKAGGETERKGSEAIIQNPSRSDTGGDSWSSPDFSVTSANKISFFAQSTLSWAPESVVCRGQPAELAEPDGLQSTGERACLAEVGQGCQPLLVALRELLLTETSFTGGLPKVCTQGGIGFPLKTLSL